MNLACIVAHMTLPEALVAATINAAAALGRSDVQGSLECGKMADMVVLDAPRSVCRHHSSVNSLNNKLLCNSIISLIAAKLWFC
jgi:imidazolonepropionase-like amidohydrolase